MSDSYAARPLEGVAETGQNAGFSSAVRPPETTGARERNGAGPDFLLELSRQGRDEAKNSPPGGGEALGREARPQSAAAYAPPAAGASAQGAPQSAAGAGAVSGAGQAPDPAGQNLPPHAGAFRSETSGADAAAAYKAVQDRARPVTSLAPWGTGISYLV